MPSTLEKFAAIVANEDLAFFRSLYVIDWQGLFVYTSHAGSLVSMATIGQDDVIGYGDLSRERDELKDKCEALEHGNAEVEKELVELRRRPR